MPTVHLDSRDQRLVDERMRARAVLEADDRPLAGDLVRMPDGALRRIARHWRDDSGWDGGVQLSAGGRFHLTRSGDCSFSGTLDPTIPPPGGCGSPASGRPRRCGSSTTTSPAAGGAWTPPLPF